MGAFLAATTPSKKIAITILETTSWMQIEIAPSIIGVTRFARRIRFHRVWGAGTAVSRLVRKGSKKRISIGYPSRYTMGSLVSVPFVGSRFREAKKSPTCFVSIATTPTAVWLGSGKLLLVPCARWTSRKDYKTLKPTVGSSRLCSIV